MTVYSFTKVFNDKSGWYCGDFHVHTNLGDGYRGDLQLNSHSLMTVLWGTGQVSGSGLQGLVPPVFCSYKHGNLFI